MWNRPQLLTAIADLLLAAAAAALLVAGTVWVAKRPHFTLSEVVVMHELKEVRRAEVARALAGLLRGNFFSVNLDLVRGTLEKLPWVRRVAVRRVWPARLEVSVEEHKPVARWGDGRGELVNSYGEVFAALAAEDELRQMPVLFGPPGTSKEVLTRYGEFAGVVEPIGEKPAQLLLSPRLSWQLKLEHGMLIDLGREQTKAPVALRLKRFVEVYPEAVAKRSVLPTVVDLRYPNGFAMRIAGDVKGK